ncbi:MAG: thiamine pyrophosphate-dependent enzyme [Dermatophilus congolensis]|nr:thiamine pyrophosphate-dependent enzyme [Dermatophilus congolensis]
MEPLKLTIPEPQCRPGSEPDFSGVAIPPAGAAPRPELDASAESVYDLAFGIIRVLDDDGHAVGPWAEPLGGDGPLLSFDDLRAGLEHMITLRIFDERMLLAQRQQKTSFYMQHLGEEAISCAFRRALRDGDMNFPTYRQAGLLIAGGYPLLLMMNQIYSNAGDPTHGRQLPVLYSAKDYGFFSVSGNLTTQWPQAVGWAMASAIAGDTKIAAAWVGDGSTAEGDFHTGLVFASTYKPPVVMNIVNNQWAISTFSGVAIGGSRTLAHRGHGYGIPSLRVDGNDYLAVYAAANWAAERARANLGPTLIEYVTYRVGGHSTSDDPSAYRPRREGVEWPLGDPILRLKKHLIVSGEWSEEQQVALVSKVRERVLATQEESEAIGTLHSGARSSRRLMWEGVFEEIPPHVQRQREEAGF